MNWLAHLYLARHDDSAMLGALLGDFVPGRTGLDRFGATEGLEIRVHRRVDGYTDAHPAVAALRGRFAPGRQRYAGIVLDVYFDHLLARDWPSWSDVPLACLAARLYAVLQARFDELPPRLQAVAGPLCRQDWLGGYRQRDSVDHAVGRIATRLSRHGDRLVACLDELRRHEAAADAVFRSFFPQLVLFTHATREALRVAQHGGDRSG